MEVWVCFPLIMSTENQTEPWMVWHSSPAGVLPLHLWIRAIVISGQNLDLHSLQPPTKPMHPPRTSTPLPASHPTTWGHTKTMVWHPIRDGESPQASRSSHLRRIPSLPRCADQSE